MDEKTMPKADFLTSMILTAFGIAVTVMAFQMPTLAEKGQGPYAAPGLVPGFLGIIITILGAAMLIRSIIRKGHKAVVSGQGRGRFLQEVGTRRMGLTILLAVLYGFSLGRINFTLATFLFIFVFVICFEYEVKAPLGAQKKKIIWAGVLGAVASAAVTGVFQYLFLVNLP